MSPRHRLSNLWLIDRALRTSRMLSFFCLCSHPHTHLYIYIYICIYIYISVYVYTYLHTTYVKYGQEYTKPELNRRGTSQQTIPQRQVDAIFRPHMLTADYTWVSVQGLGFGVKGFLWPAVPPHTHTHTHKSGAK